MVKIPIDRSSVIDIRAYFAKLYDVVRERASVGDDLYRLRPQAAVVGTTHGTYSDIVACVSIKTCKGERIGGSADHT